MKIVGAICLTICLGIFVGTYVSYAISNKDTLNIDTEEENDKDKA